MPASIARFVSDRLAKAVVLPMSSAPLSRAGLKIEAMRALATVLLVAYHAIVDTPEAGLGQAYPSPLAILRRLPDRPSDAAVRLCCRIRVCRAPTSAARRSLELMGMDLL